MIHLPNNLFSEDVLRYHLTEVLFALCLGFLAYEREIPSNPRDLWGEQTEPSGEMIQAKLVRYSSNLYACAYAYPETVMESNLDYDLRQYLTFLYVFAKNRNFDLLDIAQDYINRG